MSAPAREYVSQTSWLELFTMKEKDFSIAIVSFRKMGRAKGEKQGW